MNNLSHFKLPIEKTDDVKLYRAVVKIIARELSLITKPCYAPKLIKYWNDLYKISNFNKNQVKEFKNSLTPYYRKFNIINNNETVFYTVSYILIISNKKEL